MASEGYSVLEVLVSIAILTVLAGFSVPPVLAARDDARAKCAVDYLGATLHSVRLEALKRHANVAVRFLGASPDVRYALYVDGNGNGVRTTDIDTGVDGCIREVERIEQQCPGVRLALDADTLSIDGEPMPGADAVQVGSSRMVSFSPLGTSSSGTIYLLGHGRRQFAVRVLGPTGRIRALEYSFSAHAWQPR
jgi:type II secretory pathway pseudopilin PulG